MPNFSYVAIDRDGKQIKGVIEAADAQQVTAALKGEGKFPVDIAESGVMNRSLNVTLFESKPKPRDLAVFCRQFVSISAAGVPIVSALEMLSEQTEKENLARAIAECRTSIQSGNSFTESLREHPKIFPSLLSTMVAAGEESGSLETSFARMGTQFEKDARLKAMVQRASIYPIIVIVVAFLVVVAMLAFVIPNFEKVFNDMGTQLPALTRAVIAAGRFMQAYWWAVILGVGLAVFGTFRFSKTATGRQTLSGLQLKLPLFGKLTTKTAAARISRTLSTLLAAGIQLPEALEIVSRMMDNVKFRDALLTARDDVMMGMPLSEPFVRAGIFPPLVCHMTRIGEEAGDLDNMLATLADYYDEEVENTTATIMAALEPILIIVLAIIIGTIVLSIILPMTDMYTALDNL